MKNSDATMKRIKIENEDRMSELPDSLLAEILSRLPWTKEAIRTCILSKRWTRVWTYFHNLDFKYDDESYRMYEDRKHSRFDFFSYVDKTLNQWSSQLMLNEFKLELQTSHNVQIQSQVNKWIHYAVNRNVKSLDFKSWIGDEARFELDQFFYNNLCTTYLKLTGCVFNPVGAITWKNLKSLYILCGRLEDDLIENMLSGSPQLETLVLDLCYGFRRLNITSKSVKNVVFSGYDPPGHKIGEYERWQKKSDQYDDIIEINAPNILSLKIQNNLLLWKLSLVDVSSLVKAELDYSAGGYYMSTRKAAEEELLKGFLLKLPHVEELKIGKRCYKALNRLEVKGFIIPSNVKLLGADVTSTVFSDSDSDSLEWLEDNA